MRVDRSYIFSVKRNKQVGLRGIGIVNDPCSSKFCPSRPVCPWLRSGDMAPGMRLKENIKMVLFFPYTAVCGRQETY
jgi:hypothetical protein